jgi:hypothetical protein
MNNENADKIKQRFSKKLAIDVLRKHYREESHKHNHSEDEFKLNPDGEIDFDSIECEFCRSCKLITTIARELNIFGEVTYSPAKHYGRKALSKDFNGETILINDNDRRIRSSRLK